MASVPNRLYMARSPEGAEIWIPASEMPTSEGAGDLLAANNLNDVASVSSSRTNLGLGTAAQAASADFATAAQGVKADGAIIGPASAINNNLVVFDGTTGKLAKDGGTPAEMLAALGVSRWIGPYKVNCFALQQVADVVAGDVSGGTFTVTHDEDTTSALAWDASAATVKTALEALASIGVGGIVSIVGDDVNGGYLVTFNGNTAAELLTASSASLTGPSSPYSVTSISPSNGSYPLRDFVAGEVLEDIFISPEVAFDPSGSLYFADNVDGTGDSGGWATEVDEGLANFDLTNTASYARMYGNEGSDPAGAMSLAAQGLMVAAVNAGDPAEQRVPIIVRNATTIYAYLENLNATPAAGEVWIWLKIATTEAP